MKINTTFLLNKSCHRIDKIAWRKVYLKMNKKLQKSLRQSYKKETDFNVYLRRKISAQGIEESMAQFTTDKVIKSFRRKRFLVMANLRLARIG
jgi:hypothetical protein